MLLKMFTITFLYLLIFTAFGSYQINGFYIDSLIVPKVTDFRSPINLTCNYNMGLDKLNSVKWYKDNKEFFRYAPMMNPTVMKFDVIGVTLIDEYTMCNNVTCTIYLTNLNQKSNGAYRCEISGEAPAFNLIDKTSNMTIAALPQYKPVITGLNENYEIDEFLIANCSSDRTFPAAKLIWFIDNEKAPPHYLQPQHETTITMNNFTLHSHSQTIQFRIDQTHFNNSHGTMKLKCLARIDKYPEKSVESIVTVYISSSENLLNEKLIIFNSRSVTFLSISYLQLVSILLILIFHINNS